MALCVAKRHQFAALRGQQLLRMPVGRRHHGIAGAEGIGQRARRDLRLRKIGREVNVRRADKPHQFVQLDEAVEEHNMLLHAEVLGHPLKAQAVQLALIAQQIGVRLAHDDENRSWEIRR